MALQVDGLTTPQQAITNNNVAVQWGQAVVGDLGTLYGLVKPFSWKSETTNLGTGVVGFYGGPLADGTVVVDGTHALVGTATRYVYVDTTGIVDSVTSLGSLPANAGVMFQVPYSAGAWQTPVPMQASPAALAAFARNLNTLIGAASPSIYAWFYRR